MRSFGFLSFSWVCAAGVAVLSLLATGTTAFAQERGSITTFEFSSVAVDYPANGGASLQGSAGQVLLSGDIALAGGQASQQAALGFWETGVKFLYKVFATLDGFRGDASQVDLNARVWNTFGEPTESVVVRADNTGLALVRSWANPTFVNGISVKGDRWLRRSSGVSLIVNPYSDYPTATVLLLSGDVTNDNKTDRFDYNAFKSAFGSRPGDALWNPLADLDGDGLVGRFDYNLFKANFGLQGDN